MKKIIIKLVLATLMVLTLIAPMTTVYASFEEDMLSGNSGAPAAPAAPSAAEQAANQAAAGGQVGPTGTDLASPDLDKGTGVRISNYFKPINAPDAINQNYTSSTVNAFLQFLAGSLIEITAGIAVFVLVIAGYMFVTAGGDQGQIDKAKEVIKYTIFGMLMIIMSYAIVKTIISLIIEVDTF